MQEDVHLRRNESPEEKNMPTKMERKLGLLGQSGSIAPKTMKEKKGMKRILKSKFEEFLEMDTKDACAEEDLEMERRLAKKLKLKDGKLRGMDDEMDMLLDGIPSVLDSFNKGEVPDANQFPIEEEVKDATSDKKHKKKKSSKESPEDGNVDVMGAISELQESSGAEQRAHDAEAVLQETSKKEPAVASSIKYVAPHLRSCAGNESEEHIQIRRRIRGLLNKLSESNVESITGEIATIFRSTIRSASTQIIIDEVLAACSGGPRGNEQYAAVFAAFVAGLTCSVGMDFSAKFMALLAKAFEDECLKEDHISLRNLTLLLSYLCIFGVCSSDLIYDFLIMLSKRLREIDVSTILTVLNCCGMKIRSDDPTAMKNFIQSVHNRVNELKAASVEGQANINGKRMEFMLETIFDIKNNKKRPKEETAPHGRIKKWLQKLRVEEILIRGLKWSKLLDPDNKGQWWLSGGMAAKTDNVQEVANTIDKDVLEAQRMLQLASSQRMNTDARKAIFCIIMSGEDYIDAFEKLLRLDLVGKQDREIMRVVVECCLQEKIFNKYYTTLASKLCEHDKNHKFTLQFCIWDHFKELESMQLLRSMNLAKFIAEMIGSFTLSLAVLKSVELSDVTQLTPKRIMHFRMLFEALFEYPDEVIWNSFTRVAVTPELETLRHGIEFFIREYVVKTNKALANKFKISKKALNNTEGSTHVSWRKWLLCLVKAKFCSPPTVA
ncbi:NUCLEOLAR MIF4G DOMAIN-CONTAINING PROTEIN 1 [Salix koriyanagi]|uniref:NUCLEOLAR MIF4G DOMAIN-CONTAINING PROTEIN 1 n=1 Tax=Salix koriyanagi TaxID=2511006 RepID=A0A9Q0VZF8_9ROSI|nr:NUCLEOLAR MIF4G DOMAIN-CONTAINING PROTEIN 1 [Salix koriyanagi]